ncbi:MAG TPA: PRC-barrel domain-containing protein [Verrucomicrobiae bacterium]|nr:PRC-barrel domain-containing protein [Verrucomicrobiae bacterium]
MIRDLKGLLGSRVFAVDGEVGKVEDFYFDAEKWTLRYFVVQTGDWLLGRRVLVSAAAFSKPRPRTGIVSVNFTKETIANSPEVGCAPLARWQEKELHDYYGWDPYWEEAEMDIIPPLGNEFNAALGAISPFLHEDGRDEIAALHSIRNLRGARIEALDGPIGHLDTFMVDDHGWVIRYAAIDTHAWLQGKKVVLACQWITDVQSGGGTGKVLVHLTREKIEQGPEYRVDIDLDRAYEEQLCAHYDQERYWVPEWDEQRVA